MTEPVWLTSELVMAIHARHLEKFGGRSGMRDFGLLQSALDRPRNKWVYSAASITTLAASYAYAIARSHPFIDGNKRTAFLAMVTFLGLNGINFAAPEPEVVATFQALAAGAMAEDALALWIKDCSSLP